MLKFLGYVLLHVLWPMGKYLATRLPGVLYKVFKPVLKPLGALLVTALKLCGIMLFYAAAPFVLLGLLLFAGKKVRGNRGERG